MMSTRLMIARLIAALAFLSSLQCENKFQVCVVDGRGSFKRAAKYCPILDGPDSKVECVIGLDRLDCLRRISKGKADFSVFTPEDLVTASNLEIEVLVTNELRYTDDQYEYEVVAVISDEAGINNRYDLRDKKFCHPGFGYEAHWTRILANYLELAVVPQTCNTQLTLTENRIRASSKYFKSACKAGPWVNEPQLDQQLKEKYPNLCELCDSPNVCSTNDKYWGRSGPLLCLTDGAGDITWARLDDLRSHFGLTSGKPISSPDGYSFLCPDGSTMALNATVNSTVSPCIWVAKPWPVIATKRTKAQDIQELMSSLSHVEPDSWKSALLNLLETYHVFVANVNPIEAIESYLARPMGFLSANSFPGCHPPRTIRMCTTSNIENAKCTWLREAATVYGIEPDIDCLRADNKTHCMDAIVQNIADVVVVTPDLIQLAKTKYNLKTFFYETATDESKYITVAVVKKDSGIGSFRDLEGKKACFPVYDGIAWNSVLYSLQNKNLFKYCNFTRGMAKFFGPSCVSNLTDDEGADLKRLCKGDLYDGEYGAMRCLTHENADVAFVSQNTFENYFKDQKQKGNIQVDKSQYRLLCDGEPCHLSWSPPGQAMIRSNRSSLWIKDSLDVFLQMDDLFGKNYKSLTTPFNLFGLFDGQPDILFQDSSVRLRELPTVKQTDKMAREYDNILEEKIECTATGAGAVFKANYLFVSGLFLYLLFQINV